MFFLYLLPDNISVINYNFINAEFILSIKDILHMKNHLNMRKAFSMGVKQICLIWYALFQEL